MKKKIIYSFIFFILILLIFIIIVFLNFTKNKNMDKDNSISKIEDEFRISKIEYYSSANGISNTTNYQNPEWNLKVYQYTDLAIYIERINDISDKNYIEKLYLENFKVTLEDSKVYYINPIMFGNSTLNNDDMIEEKLDYTIVNSANEKNEINYNIPIYFQDCSNPITIRIVKTLSDSYKISNENSLSYNGSLIRELGFDLDSLINGINFDLNIVTNSGKVRNRNIEIDFPLYDSEKSILDGDYKTEINSNISF